MIGRFVQQQDIRFRQQQAAQAEAGTLSAGKQAGLHILEFPEFQSRQHALDRGLPSVSVGTLKLPGQAVIPPAQNPQLLRVRTGFGHFLLQPAQFGFHAPLGFKDAFQGLQDRFLSGQLTLLGQVAQFQPFLQVDASLVRGFQSGDDLHQGAFSAAVHTHQSHALSRLKGKGNRLQHLMGAEALLNILQGKDNHGFILFLSMYRRFRPHPGGQLPAPHPAEGGFPPAPAPGWKPFGPGRGYCFPRSGAPGSHGSFRC